MLFEQWPQEATNSQLPSAAFNTAAADE